MYYYLIYLSSASWMQSAEELTNLLSEARQENKRLGITGLLLHKGGKFMQCVEGPKDEVLELLERIKRDARHTDVAVVLEGEIRERMFPDWSMGFLNMDGLDQQGFEAYLDRALARVNMLPEAVHALSFIKTFNR